MKKAKILMVMLSCVALLSACGSKEKAKASDDGGSKGEDLSIWVPNAMPASIQSNDDYPFYQALNKKTGTNVKWINPTDSSNPSQSFNLMLAENEYPDMIQNYFIGATSIQVGELLHDGVIRDLTNDLEKKAPNYWKFLKEHPDFDKAMKTDDNKYFGFGLFREDEAQTTYLGPVIRQDWLDEQHLKMPETIKDFENVIRVFNKKYGAKYAFVPDWTMVPGPSGAFGAFGTLSPYYYVDEAGKIQLGHVQPEWKNYMEWLHGLYKEGLIDPDVTTMTGDELHTKAANNKVGIANAGSGDLTVLNTTAKSSDPNCKWVAMPYPKQADGKPSAAIYGEGGMATARVTAISSTPKGEKLDKVFKWLDWAFSKEGNEFWNWGDTKNWEMKDGVHVWKDNITKSDVGLTEAITLNSGMVTNAIGVQQQQLDNSFKSKEAQEAGPTWKNSSPEALKRIIPASVTMTSEEAKKATDIQTTLDSYVAENSLKFLTGEKSLDEYDNFVKELKGMKLDELLKYKQAAYDRYLKR